MTLTGCRIVVAQTRPRLFGRWARAKMTGAGGAPPRRRMQPPLGRLSGSRNADVVSTTDSDSANRDATRCEKENGIIWESLPGVDRIHRPLLLWSAHFAFPRAVWRRYGYALPVTARLSAAEMLEYRTCPRSKWTKSRWIYLVSFRETNFVSIYERIYVLSDAIHLLFSCYLALIECPSFGTGRFELCWCRLSECLPLRC